MRIRPIAALSVAALSAVLLAGCAGGANPNATPTPSTSGAAADLCAAAAPSGAATESITVEGEVGKLPFSAMLRRATRSQPVTS